MPEMNDTNRNSVVDPLSERELEILCLIEEGCTNREIALRLVLSLETIKWYNKQIYSKLGVNNRIQAVTAAKEAGLIGLPSEKPEQSAVQPQHNLPAQITSFIGRQREIAEIQELLSTNRLLTLTGPPGTGKSRLALQVAWQARYKFEDGVYFVELAPIHDPGLVTTTIAKVLGIGESGNQPLIETLKKYLQQKCLLLLLDNFEQILDAAPLVGELLSSSPGLQALVTSREVLRIYGEQEYPVPPLALPDLDRTEPAHCLLQYEAIDLFTQRAQTVRLDFALTEDNAQAVAEICVRLDGLPLALELAAARINMLSPEMIRRRLESRLGVLVTGPRDSPARQQTLREAIDWSYDLLEPPEKILFARLAVFQGGRTVEAVQAICSHGLKTEVFAGLESLLNKNLLRRVDGAAKESRFVMLELIHEYAWERLLASGEAEDLQRRHAEYFLALAEQAASVLRGDRYVYWSSLLRDEYNNLRTALAWALDGGDAELGLQLTGALRDFWFFEGHTAEGLAWSERALECAKDEPSILRARAFNTAGNMCWDQADHSKGKQYNREALAIFRDLGNDIGAAWALAFLGVQALGSPEECKEGLKFLEEALVLFHKLDFKPGVIQTLIGIGEVALLDGDYERADQAYSECGALASEQGDRMAKAKALGNSSYIQHQKGKYDEAVDLLKRAITLFRDLDARRYICQDFARLGGPVAAQGHPHVAARLLGASEALLEVMGIGLQACDRYFIKNYVTTVREQLDQKTFDAAWKDGRAMSYEQTITYALEYETVLTEMDI
jgi:predicted ATPase/DNA-binding CsgD family transcriptional regulator